MNEKMSVKKFIKVWSQAGTSLIAAFVAFAVMRNWINWDSATVAQFMIIYGAAMMILRQMFSVTEDPNYVGEVNAAIDEEGTKVYSFAMDQHPDTWQGQKTATFKINPVPTQTTIPSTTTVVTDEGNYPTSH